MAWLVRLAVSVVGGGVLYGAWLAVVLATMGPPSSPRPFLVMLTAPIVTAFGFALGTVLGERLTRGYHVRLSRAIRWPLVGCVVGALLMYPFGPMLIVFGMFGLGTVAVATREAWAHGDAKRR